MFASRIARQMASGANKDPTKIKKENQRVVRRFSPPIRLKMGDQTHHFWSR